MWNWFPCVYKQMLRRFPRFQVATTCYSCSPPDLNLVVTNFIFCTHVKLPLPPGDNLIAVNNNSNDNNNYYYMYGRYINTSTVFMHSVLYRLKENTVWLNGRIWCINQTNTEICCKIHKNSYNFHLNLSHPKVLDRKICQLYAKFDNENRYFNYVTCYAISLQYVFNKF